MSAARLSGRELLRRYVGRPWSQVEPELVRDVSFGSLRKIMPTQDPGNVAFFDRLTVKIDRHGDVEEIWWG